MERTREGMCQTQARGIYREMLRWREKLKMCGKGRTRRVRERSLVLPQRSVGTSFWWEVSPESAGSTGLLEDLQPVFKLLGEQLFFKNHGPMGPKPQILH